ncbi:MAG: LUD domain-containing protein, partial [Lentimicrobium sp.]|nr:LUD domain-containing protein [Lentimicrobium sp.]
ASFFNTSAEAADYICNQITPGMRVAFGGSMTVRAMEIRERAASLGAVLIDHGAAGLSEEERLEVMRQELTSDLFISSTNAVTVDGTMINVDGYGNRVAAMIFGPKKVIIVAGINKVVSNEKAAFKRLEQIAGPMNMKRLNRDTPCTHDAVCHNCQSAARGCRAYTILRKRPAFTPTDVLIIGEVLGM